MSSEHPEAAGDMAGEEEGQEEVEQPLEARGYIQVLLGLLP